MRSHFAEVDQSSRETEGGVDTSSSVTCETLLRWELGAHLSESQHDTEAGDTHDDVGYEHTSGARAGKTGSRTDDQTGTWMISVH